MLGKPGNARLRQMVHAAEYHSPCGTLAAPWLGGRGVVGGSHANEQLALQGFWAMLYMRRPVCFDMRHGTYSVWYTVMISPFAAAKRI